MAHTNVLSLCSGGGGLDFGLRLAVPGARTVVYVENEITACGVLAARMEDESLDAAPIWTDLRTFDGSPWRGTVDWVIGGYPCQPFSNAGKRLGDADPRHLWPAVQRIVADVQPEYCFFENVGAHLRLGFHEVARSLQGMGYRVAATLLTASEVGAPHGRERLFILAHSPRFVQREPDNEAGAESWREPRGNAGGYGLDVAHAEHVERGPSAEGRDVAYGHDAGRYQEAGWVTQRSRTDVADPDISSGGPEPRQQHQERAEVAAGTGAVGNFSGLRRGEGRPEHGVRGGRDAVTGAERPVGDTDLPRLEGRQQPVISRGNQLPAWPPGPADTNAWRRVLDLRSDLAPAVEPPFRGVADGMGRGMDLARADQLHILGNGVVPQQAAYALRLLMESHMTE